MARSAGAGASVPNLQWKIAISSRDDYVLRLALGNDGTIYAGTWAGSSILGLAPDGTLRRKLSVGNNVHSLTVQTDGTIYAATGYDDPYLYVFAPDGSLKRRFQSNLTFRVGGTFDAIAPGHDGTLYAASSDGYVYALHSDGTFGWKSPGGGGRALAIGRDGTIYTGAESGLAVHTIASDGTPGANFKVGGGVAALLMGRGGLLYVGSLDRTVYALDPKDGTTKWSFNTRGTPFGLAEGHHGTVYVGSFNGNVYALDPKRGTLRWRFSTGSGQWGSNPVHAVAVGHDGVVYAGSGVSVVAINPPTERGQ